MREEVAPSAESGRREVRVSLPTHLRTLARVSRDVRVEVDEPVTIGRVLDVLEARHPVLRGTIRDQRTKERRAFIRYFGDRDDLSNEPIDALLPEEVRSGRAPFRVIGAISGG